MEYKSRYLREAGVHSIVCGPENDTNRETSQLSLNKNLNHRPVIKSYRLVTTTCYDRKHASTSYATVIGEYKIPCRGSFSPCYNIFSIKTITRIQNSQHHLTSLLYLHTISIALPFYGYSSPIARPATCSTSSRKSAR